MHKSITEKQISLTTPAPTRPPLSTVPIMQCWGVVNLHMSNFFRIYYLFKCIEPLHAMIFNYSIK